MDVLEAIRTKRAVRQFTNEALSEAVIRRILDSGRRSQSSKNTQPWHFIVIRNRDTLLKLSKMGDYMGHVAGAALCIAVVTPPWSSHGGWIAFDAGQTAAYMQLAAQELGVGTVIGTVFEPDKARELLGFPATLECQIVLSLGYPAPQPPRAPRLGARRTLDEIVHWDHW